MLWLQLTLLQLEGQKEGRERTKQDSLVSTQRHAAHSGGVAVQCVPAHPGVGIPHFE